MEGSQIAVSSNDVQALLEAVEETTRQLPTSALKLRQTALAPGIAAVLQLAGRGAWYCCEKMALTLGKRCNMEDGDFGQKSGRAAV